MAGLLVLVRGSSSSPTSLPCPYSKAWNPAAPFSSRKGTYMALRLLQMEKGSEVKVSPHPWSPGLLALESENHSRQHSPPHSHKQTYSWMQQGELGGRFCPGVDRRGHRQLWTGKKNRGKLINDKQQHSLEDTLGKAASRLKKRETLNWQWFPMCVNPPNLMDYQTGRGKTTGPKKKNHLDLFIKFCIALM